MSKIFSYIFLLTHHVISKLKSIFTYYPKKVKLNTSGGKVGVKHYTKKFENRYCLRHTHIRIYTYTIEGIHVNALTKNDIYIQIKLSLLPFLKPTTKIHFPTPSIGRNLMGQA